MFKLARYLKGHVAPTVMAPVCKLIEAIFELIVPMIVANVIDIGIPSGDKAYVITRCIIIAALAVAGFIISATGQYLASKVALTFGTKLRSETFAHINALPLEQSDRLGSASLVTRITGDAINCQNALNVFLRLVLRIPFVLVGAFVMSMTIDPVLSLMFALMSVILVCVIACVLKLTMPRVKAAQKNLDEISRLSTQSLTGARVIRAFSKQDDACEQFSDAADTTAKTNIAAAMTSALLNPLTFAVVNLAIIAVLWLGGGKVNSGTLSQGELVALINYLTQAFFVIVNVGNIFPVFMKSTASAARVNEVLDTPIPADGTADTVTVPSDGSPVLAFKNVSFAYEGDYDVRDISFELSPDQTLGIIGGTGSGKTTVINLIERFRDPDIGSIEFCGRPITEYSLSALRGCLGYVPQRAAVMSGTLDSNLRIADPLVTEEREKRALTLAQASELLDSLGLNGHIATNGKNLSGGQRQRVNIARALCRENLIYLFDDSTSALDYKTERDFINVMKQVRGAKIFVSQRISAVSGCDRILVLDGGVIVGIGTHETLKTDCPLYAEFCASQSE